ncbi:MAG: aminotransferase class III-fold pyridoxal phosphate-dependent enzyme, partial [Flavobacteriales bacterium]|nr:aminotransferase class III-fold pyridoxal phosphate-dependent enzyme [Flavobacteriales bacterium]
MNTAVLSESVQNSLDYTLFSWSKQKGLNPIDAVRGEGVYLYDSNGKKYIDFSSQLINVNIGHGNRKVIEAITSQLQQLQFVYPGMSTDPRGQLGKRLAEIAPGNLSKTFFTLGGAEANENAIKLARTVTGRSKIMSFYRSYHGATYAAMSAGGDPRKFAMDNAAVPNMIHVHNPYYYRCPYGSSSEKECAERTLHQIEETLKYENPESFAAFILEGQSGSSGCILYPQGFVKALHTLLQKYGILLIDDEVMSGFGRTGKMFAIEHHDVVPDIMTIAKGLTSGYLPLGGVMMTPQIAEHFNDQMLPLGLTYSAHPVACAAGVANLEVFDELNLVSNAAEKGNIVDAFAARMFEKHQSIGDWRNQGLLGCFELVKNRDSKEPITPWNAHPSQMEPTQRMLAKVRELGMFTFVR